MKNPNKPIRYEIRGTSGSGTFKTVCGRVSSEGTHSQNGFGRSIDTGNTPISFASAGVEYLLLGIELKAGWEDHGLIIEKITALASTPDDVVFRLYLNPTVTGLPTATALRSTSSGVNYYVGNGTAAITAGTGDITDVNYLRQSSSAEISQNTSFRLGTKIGGTRDKLILTVHSLNNAFTASASMGFREFI